MAVSIQSVSCCVLNHHNLFCQIQNALAFNRDTCCHLALCLWILPFHWPRNQGKYSLAYCYWHFTNDGRLMYACLGSLGDIITNWKNQGRHHLVCDCLGFLGDTTKNWKNSCLLLHCPRNQGRYSLACCYWHFTNDGRLMYACLGSLGDTTKNWK